MNEIAYKQRFVHYDSMKFYDSVIYECNVCHELFTHPVPKCPGCEKISNKNDDQRLTTEKIWAAMDSLTTRASEGEQE